jgi:adenylate cyclase
MFAHVESIAPCAAAGWLWSSYTYSYVGDGREAVRRAARALELSPIDRNAHDYYMAQCIAHYVVREFDAAADWGRKALATPPILLASIRWTAAALAAAGKIQQAREVAAQGLRTMPEQWVSRLVKNSPFVDESLRETYGRHLLDAGLPQ